jgi:hypothetical protein
LFGPWGVNIWLEFSTYHHNTVSGTYRYFAFPSSQYRPSAYSELFIRATIQWDKIKFGIFPNYNQNPKVNKVWDFCWLQSKLGGRSLQARYIVNNRCFWRVIDYKSWHIVMVNVLVVAENPKLYFTPLYTIELQSKVSLGLRSPTFNWRELGKMVLNWNSTTWATCPTFWRLILSPINVEGVILWPS